ncbi:hypothetical protein [Streptomyces yangpuensis]|uniref:hypothetical protein n=1 Tax=Streptomyces yangpuensis TaxID=1648182 RepID=UPI00371D68AF
MGAHVLADCLAQDLGDHRAAYARYEQRMRPYVTLNQALATELRRNGLAAGPRLGLRLVRPGGALGDGGDGVLRAPPRGAPPVEHRFETADETLGAAGRGTA